MATAETPEQVVDVLRYVLEGKLPARARALSGTELGVLVRVLGGLSPEVLRGPVVDAALGEGGIKATFPQGGYCVLPGSVVAGEDDQAPIRIELLEPRRELIDWNVNRARHVRLAPVLLLADVESIRVAACDRPARLLDAQPLGSFRSHRISGTHCAGPQSGCGGRRY